jgi:hypothetical protein
MLNECTDPNSIAGSVGVTRYLFAALSTSFIGAGLVRFALSIWRFDDITYGLDRSQRIRQIPFLFATYSIGRRESPTVFSMLPRTIVKSSASGKGDS